MKSSLAGFLVAAAMAAACEPGEPSSGGNPVATENALPGDRGWMLHKRAPPGTLEGYAGKVSVNHGEDIDVHVRSNVERTLSWKLYRMGWYGGAEGRLIASGGPVPVGPQPTPAPTADTGLIECRWPITFTISTSPTWTSGMYLVVLTRDDGPQSYVIFVVRADERRGGALFQAAFTTYQAYNAFGGKSLYDGGPAQEVSFDRPYVQGSGAGQYFRWEHDFVRWAESRGYDLTYATGVDLDRDPSILRERRLFISVGHDEYWSANARGALERAIASGMSAAFLSANSIYWQIRLEPAKGDGTPRRTQVCYKKQSARDPLRGTPLETVRWRDPPVNRPENALLGVMYTCWEKDMAGDAWKVTNPGNWVYDGSGFEEGDSIPGIIGYETDRLYDNGQTPPGTQTISRSPVVDVTGRADVQQGAVHEIAGGAFVFAAGTIQWSWGLSRPGIAHAGVQRITENVLRRAGLAPASP